MAPVKLPRYVIFVGDNGLNLRLKEQEGHQYLMFNSDKRDLEAAQEVIPAPGYEDVVMIKSLDDDKYWRREPGSNWIWADKSDPKADDKDCLFKVVQVNDETAALQCLANSRYLTRFTTGDKLRVTSGLDHRRVLGVVYDLKKMTEPLKSPPKTLGSQPETNNAGSTTNLRVVVPYYVESKYSWRTVTTFNTGLRLHVTAGIPDFASKTVGKEVSKQVTNGKTKADIELKAFKYTVEGVAPDETVEVEIKGSPAKATVPFTYKFVDVRVDGKELPEASGDDGVFEGEQVLDIKPVEKPRKKPVESDSSGTAKQAI